MPAVFLRKYGTGTGANVPLPMVKAGAVDFATSSDWTPASGDVKVSKDGGSQANIGTLPTYTNGDWVFTFSDAELQCKVLSVRIVDSATKAVEDSAFNVETYGHASAMYQADLSAANLPANVIQWGGTAVASANVLIDGAITAAKIAADAITDAKVASDVTINDVTTKTGYKLASDGLDSISTTAPSGVASNFREMLVQVWRRFFKRATLTASELVTYADDNSTPVTTQALSDNGTTQVQGPAS